jgi:hypothetical protein
LIAFISHTVVSACIFTIATAKQLLGGLSEVRSNVAAIRRATEAAEDHEAATARSSWH